MSADFFDGTEWAKRRRGRPAFKKNKENQWIVDSMLRQGFGQKEIATRLGCSVPTLKRKFSASPFWNPSGRGKRRKGTTDET